jgi:hypothetical protein
MDTWTALFWLGFFILLLAHLQLLRQHMQTATRQHAFVALTGLVFMFVGSKIGREFLGIV